MPGKQEKNRHFFDLSQQVSSGVVAILECIGVIYRSSQG